MVPITPISHLAYHFKDGTSQITGEFTECRIFKKRGNLIHKT